MDLRTLQRRVQKHLGEGSVHILGCEPRRQGQLIRSSFDHQGAISVSKLRCVGGDRVDWYIRSSGQGGVVRVDGYAPVGVPVRLQVHRCLCACAAVAWFLVAAAWTLSERLCAGW